MCVQHMLPLYYLKWKLIIIKMKLRFLMCVQQTYSFFLWRKDFEVFCTKVAQFPSQYVWYRNGFVFAKCFVPEWLKFRRSMFGTETASFSQSALCQSGSSFVVVCLVPKRLRFQKIALCQSGTIFVVVCLVLKRLRFQKLLCAKVAQFPS